MWQAGTDDSKQAASQVLGRVFLEAPVAVAGSRDRTLLPVLTRAALPDQEAREDRTLPGFGGGQAPLLPKRTKREQKLPCHSLWTILQQQHSLHSDTLPCNQDTAL